MPHAKTQRVATERGCFGGRSVAAGFLAVLLLFVADTQADETGDSLPRTPIQVDGERVDPASELRTSDNDYFSVVGPDFTSTRAVSRISEHAAEFTQGWLHDGRRPQQVIAVQLIPTEQFSSTGNVELSTDGRGGVLLSFRWGAELTLKQLCDGLARAFLVRMLWQQDPLADPESVPDWLVQGLSGELQTHWLPGIREAFIEEAKDLDPLPLERLLKPAPESGFERDAYALDSYWLLRFLRQELQEPSASAWHTLLSGENIPWHRWIARLPFVENPSLRELWWVAGRTHFLRSRRGPILSLSESRDSCLRLAFVVYEGPAGDGRMSGEALIELIQKEQELDLFLSERVRSAKLLLTRINPLYYNSLVELGQFFEDLDAGEFEQATLRYQQFLHDFQVAETLHRQADILLAE